MSNNTCLNSSSVRGKKQSKTQTSPLTNFISVLPTHWVSCLMLQGGEKKPTRILSYNKQPKVSTQKSATEFTVASVWGRLIQSIKTMNKPELKRDKPLLHRRISLMPIIYSQSVISDKILIFVMLKLNLTIISQSKHSISGKPRQNWILPVQSLLHDGIPKVCL